MDLGYVKSKYFAIAVVFCIYSPYLVKAMTYRPRVLLLIPHLGGGGAERVTALLARGLSSSKYELHLGLITQADAGPEPLPDWIQVHALGARRVRSAAFRLLRLIRRIKPNVILSSMAHLNFMVLLLRPFYPRNTRVLVRQNGTASAALAFGDQPGYTRLLYRLLYRHADRVICQTNAMANDLACEFGMTRAHLPVLLNPVDVDAIRDAVCKSPNQWTGPGPHLLAVGRLAPVKGFDLLLNALVIVRERFPDADLVIAGAGAEEAALKSECYELGLESAVRFAGHVDRPSVYFPGASLFVLSSRHEGLPNALLEAAAGGLPLVAMPASDGVTDLLHALHGAWLATEITAPALAASLLAALEVLKQGQRFEHPFIEEFRVDCAIHAYEDLIDATLLQRQS
jgi:glycosyltransferase involved in cell wall biosynthesis